MRGTTGALEQPGPLIIAKTNPRVPHALHDETVIIVTAKTFRSRSKDFFILPAGTSRQHDEPSRDKGQAHFNA